MTLEALPMRLAGESVLSRWSQGGGAAREELALVDEISADCKQLGVQLRRAIDAWLQPPPTSTSAASSTSASPCASASPSRAASALSILDQAGAPGTTDKGAAAAAAAATAAAMASGAVALTRLAPAAASTTVEQANDAEEWGEVLPRRMSSYERERRESEGRPEAEDEEEARSDGEHVLEQENPLARSMPPPPMALEALSVDASPLVTAAASPPIPSTTDLPDLFSSDTPLPPLPPSTLPQPTLPAAVGHAARPSGEDFLQLTTALELADRAR